MPRVMDLGLAMEQISAEDFHAVVADRPRVAAVLHAGPLADHEDVARLVEEVEPGAGDWAWLGVDTDDASDLAAMFGVEAADPNLLVMRDRVVLYCAPVVARSAPETLELLQRAGTLDMQRVQGEIQAKRDNEQALAGRRVCPMAWRSR